MIGYIHMDNGVTIIMIIFCKQKKADFHDTSFI